MIKSEESDKIFENKVHQLEVSMARFKKRESIVETENIQLTDLINASDLSDIMSSFYKATGLGVGIFNNTAELIASVGWQKICSNFHQKHPEAHRGCVESENFFKQNLVAGQATSYKCKNGLWDVAYPLYLEENNIGTIYFGQFFFDDEIIDKEFFINQANKFNFDKDEYIGLLKKVPIIKKEKIEAYVQLFITIIENVAKVGQIQ